MARTQTDFLTSLAYLLGERSVNATTSAPRADFVQNALDEAYAAYPWRFSRARTTLTISSGIATLPTNYDDNHTAFAKYGTDEIQLAPLDEDDQGSAEDGDNRMWITTTSSDDERYQLNTNDTSVTSVDFRYNKKAPVLDSAGTVTTPYRNKRTIALGARRDVKLGQNPDADISQDQKLFDKAISNDIAAHQVQAPRKKRRQVGKPTGDF